ncbi:MAG TPA: MogA/MoaB family molybdenum cofactor biosynthesis protein [Actinomycetes bacterium]|nr:MogA/MoaB family molybdenum cofactor biosynthesis protein [Actinomycetes bacterium]
MADVRDDSSPEPLRVLVLTVSTRAASGKYEDRSGPAVVEALSLWGISDATVEVVSDDEEQLARRLRDAAASGVDAVLTTGGTGLAPDDRTPEATRQVIEREVPGVAEAIRSAGVDGGIASASLSRGVAGSVGRTMIINLPGSVGGARDGVAVVGPLLAHMRDQLAGGDH